MVVIFFGTPDFALPALAGLAQNHQLKAIVTQPDKPRGRQRAVKPSPVKPWAQENSLPVLEPESLSDPEFLRSIKEYAPDVIVVAAYGKIIPPELLVIPRLGCVNIHASLLPKYRGAAPIQRAIMAGARKTGVTIMQMDEGMDTGTILSQAEIPVGPGEEAGGRSGHPGGTG